MRELTQDQKVIIANRKEEIAKEVMTAPGFQGYDLAFQYGFTAGLEYQDARIAELERQLAEAKRTAQQLREKLALQYGW